MSTEKRLEDGNGSVDAREAVQLADEQLLAQLGYKQEFQRAFSPLECFGIAFSIIGLLPSIASVMFNSIPNGGPAAMVWGWAVASVFILFVGMAMAELGSAAPTSGGLYFWTYSLSSPRWRNLLCWIVGYANTIGSIAALASIDWGCAVQILAAASIGTDESYSPSDAQTLGVYAAVVLSHAVLCGLATPVLARLQTVYVVLNVVWVSHQYTLVSQSFSINLIPPTRLCFAIIIALPIATPSEFKNTASYALGDFTNMNGWPNGYAFILSFLAPLWTIGSFDSAVHISEEASNAATAVPWAIINAVGIAGILGTAINISLAFCMGTDLDAIVNSPIGQPMATIFFNSFGEKATLGVWSIVVLVQYMMGSSMLLAASRQTFAFARDGALPFSSWLYRMNSYTKTPVNTVWFVAGCSILLGLLALAGETAISAVFSISITASYVAYAIPIAARFLGDNDFKPGPFSLGVFSLPVGIVAVLFMFFMVIVFLFPTTPQTDAPDMNYTVVVMGGVLFLSIVWYYLPVYGGVHWFTGPISNIGDGVGENKLERISGDSSSGLGSGPTAEKDVVKDDKLAAEVESYS
ncbi:APC amino acid permease [Pleurotus eryngii]|uniref:APC amino acid permease n=1 Tax=Pleurotus eryngii TaxID=5323 RepID=A0A9P6DB02_PLEER|nr:APC amino acid permease [Pleurotus eryngii]